MASTASILKDGGILLEIPSFYSQFFFSKHPKSGSENLSGLNDLTICGNITGLKKAVKVPEINKKIGFFMNYPTSRDQDRSFWCYSHMWLM